MATINLDIGGTFTDCVVLSEGQINRAKSPTTRHNLSIGLKRVIEEAATRLDLSMEELLRQTENIRYSTTLAMNTLIERSGPKLGLIITAGAEDVIRIGRSRSWADGLAVPEYRNMVAAEKPKSLIDSDMIVTVSERIDCFGEVLIPLRSEEVREKVQYLVDNGARGFVVCLLWSFMNLKHERLIKEIIENEYPDHFLGNMPVMLSSEVYPKIDEYPRVNVTILNTYLQTEMTEQLNGLGMDLRDGGYARPLTIINNVGGTAKISRTRAIDTYGAGPVAGLFGAAYVSQIYGLPRVVVSDMGGTSFDYGLVKDGAPCFYNEWPVIDRWATESSMIEVKTIGAGGGSIAWINEAMGNRLEVGPQSASANPGPACYDLGGRLPTVTDADIVLGYLNPVYFLGGKMRLNERKAREAIKRISEPLGMTVEQAATAIRAVVDAHMGNTLQKELILKGENPKEYVLFAYGGAGPTHCVNYGRVLGVRKIMTFPYASVFCALGGATIDMKHIYEKSRHMMLVNSRGEYLSDYSYFNLLVEELKEIAVRDVEIEGFPERSIIFFLEFDMRYGAQHNFTRVRSPLLKVTSQQDIERIIDQFNKTYIHQFGEMTASPESGVNIESFYLVATVPLPKPELPRYEYIGLDAPKALKGYRLVHWAEFGDYRETPIYGAEALQCGNVIEGPAVIEAIDTTYVVPSGSCYRVDEYLSGIIDLA